MRAVHKDLFTPSVYNILNANNGWEVFTNSSHEVMEDLSRPTIHPDHPTIQVNSNFAYATGLDDAPNRTLDFSHLTNAAQSMITTAPSAPARVANTTGRADAGKPEVDQTVRQWTLDSNQNDNGVHGLSQQTGAQDVWTVEHGKAVPTSLPSQSSIFPDHPNLYQDPYPPRRCIPPFRLSTVDHYSSNHSMSMPTSYTPSAIQPQSASQGEPSPQLGHAYPRGPHTFTGDTSHFPTQSFHNLARTTRLNGGPGQELTNAMFQFTTTPMVDSNVIATDRTGASELWGHNGRIRTFDHNLKQGTSNLSLVSQAAGRNHQRQAELNWSTTGPAQTTVSSAANLYTSVRGSGGMHLVISSTLDAPPSRSLVVSDYNPIASHPFEVVRPSPSGQAGIPSGNSTSNPMAPSPAVAQYPLSDSVVVPSSSSRFTRIRLKSQSGPTAPHTSPTREWSELFHPQFSQTRNTPSSFTAVPASLVPQFSNVVINEPMTGFPVNHTPSFHSAVDAQARVASDLGLEGIAAHGSHYDGSAMGPDPPTSLRSLSNLKIPWQTIIPQIEAVKSGLSNDAQLQISIAKKQTGNGDYWGMKLEREWHRHHPEPEPLLAILICAAPTHKKEPCNVVCKSLDAMNRHLKTANAHAGANEGVLRCGVCPTTFQRIDALRRHETTMHSG